MIDHVSFNQLRSVEDIETAVKAAQRRSEADFNQLRSVEDIETKSAIWLKGVPNSFNQLRSVEDIETMKDLEKLPAPGASTSSDP